MRCAYFHFHYFLKCKTYSCSVVGKTDTGNRRTLAMHFRDRSGSRHSRTGSVTLQDKDLSVTSFSGRASELVIEESCRRSFI